MKLRELLDELCVEEDDPEFESKMEMEVLVKAENFETTEIISVMWDYPNNQIIIEK